MIQPMLLKLLMILQSCTAQVKNVFQNCVIFELFERNFNKWKYICCWYLCGRRLQRPAVDVDPSTDDSESRK